MIVTNVAQILGITRKTLYLRLQKPAALRAMADLQKNGVDLVKEVQTSAMRRMRRLVQSGDEKIALEAAKFVLMPMFNHAQLNVNEVKERIYRVQFGEGGQMFTDVQSVENNDKKLTPLDLLKQAEQGIEQQVKDKATNA